MILTSSYPFKVGMYNCSRSVCILPELLGLHEKYKQVQPREYIAGNKTGHVYKLSS